MRSHSTRESQPPKKMSAPNGTRVHNHEPRVLNKTLNNTNLALKMADTTTGATATRTTTTTDATIAIDAMTVVVIVVMTGAATTGATTEEIAVGMTARIAAPGTGIAETGTESQPTRLTKSAATLTRVSNPTRSPSTPPTRSPPTQEMKPISSPRQHTLLAAPAAVAAQSSVLETKYSAISRNAPDLS
jgi:hypothetical protein